MLDFRARKNEPDHSPKPVPRGKVRPNAARTDWGNPEQSDYTRSRVQPGQSIHNDVEDTQLSKRYGDLAPAKKGPSKLDSSIAARPAKRGDLTA